MKLGKPAIISIAIGTILPLLGYLASGAPATGEDILALIIIAVLNTLVVRSLIFAGQWLTSN